ncbi:hypothetical protein [Planomonospora algeriensis]
MVVWSLALALLPAGCGGGRMSQGEFEDRAREMAGRWQGSAADRAWREGFVPLEHPEAASDWKRLPAWANRSGHNGAWSLDVDLPAETPPARRLQWPDGSAVHPSAITPRPAVRDGGEYQEVTAFDPVSGRERELPLRYLHGTCDRTHGARAYETRGLVVVDVDVEPAGDRPCPEIGKIDQVTVTLEAPLGNRLMLDAGSGLPVPPSAPASH